MTDNHLTRTMVVTAEDIIKADEPNVFILPFKAIGVDVLADFDDIGTEREGNFNYTAYHFIKSLAVTVPEEDQKERNIVTLDFMPVIIQYLQETFGDIHSATIASDDEVNLDGITEEQNNAREELLVFVKRTMELVDNSETAQDFKANDETGWVTETLKADLRALPQSLVLRQAPQSVADDFDLNANAKVILDKISTGGKPREEITEDDFEEPTL